MPNALALRDFTHPATGETVLRGSVINLDRDTYRAIKADGDVIMTDEEVRTMKKVKALANSAIPSTGDTLIKGQVAALEDSDADALVTAGTARAAHDDEAITRDVGKLREGDDAALPQPKGEV